MASENVETIRRGHDRFNAGDLEGIGDVVTRDVEWGTTGAFPGIAPVYPGPDGVVAWAVDVRSVWESFDVAIEEVLVDEPGELALIVELIRGRGRESGVMVEMRAFAVYTFRDGRIARRQAFSDPAAALAAAGHPASGRP